MQRMIDFLPLFFQGILKMLGYFWPAILFFIIQIYKLWRWEREQERVAKAAERDKPKRSNCKEHIA